MITVEVNKQQEEKPKDIFFKGNIVINRHGIVVIVKESLDDLHFDGVALNETFFCSIGDNSIEFSKQSFSQFTGTITITSK